VSSRQLSIAVRVCGVVVLAVLVYVFAHHVDWRVLGHALRNAELWPLALATALFFATLLGKALLWRILLAPKNVVPVGRLYRYTIAAFAGSVLAPARAGEVLRVLALKSRDNVPVADSSAVAVTDKLLHMVTLLMLAAPLPWVLPGLPGWVGHTLLLCACIAGGLLVAAYIAVGRVEENAAASWFGRFLAGMHAVRDPRRLLAAVGLLAVVWGIDMLSIVAALRAVHIDVDLSGALFILFTLNISIALPTTPGNVGTLQLGVLLATRLLGIPNEPALAFALLYHAIQIIPLLLIGAVLEFRLMIPGRARGKLAA
jgi:glycosyltransferase 2 family protein